MIIGIGTDIVKVDRIKTDLSTYSRYLGDNELRLTGKMSQERLQSFLAGRWAAKEAIYKALVIKEDNYSLLDIDSIDGKPTITYKDYKINISISHEKDYAIAFAVIEK